MLGLVLALAATAAPPGLSLTGEKITLDNGLVVIASPDHSVPGVSVDVWYRVGSRDEEPGRTGFAHLFEHLMFMGARHAPYPSFDTIMEAAGGVNNASTSQDVTNYYEVGPANLLETFFWLEGDRLSTLDRMMTDEKLKSQRLIVQNERRQSYENRPYGMADLAVEEQVYPKGHPYSWSPIGSHADLEAATVADVVKFFRTYYVPNNAVLAVVGDVEPAKVFELARKYLAFIPRKPLPAKTRPAPYVMPAEKRVAMTDKVEAEKVLIAWPSPAAQSQGDAEADVLASVLGRGKASRLYQRLVHADQLATSVNAAQESMEYGSTFQIEAVAAPGHTTAELLAAIDDEVKKLAASGPTQAELDSSRARFETDFARKLQNLQSRAQMLANYEVVYGDPNSLQTDLGRYLKATPASLTAAAKSLFVPGRLVVEVKPEAEKPAASAGAPVGGGK
jgi:predicted Zn-dependent peptidase